MHQVYGLCPKDTRPETGENETQQSSQQTAEQTQQAAEQVSEQTEAAPAEGLRANETQYSSSETDENGRPLVLTKSGSTEFGFIDAESGLTHAPICLSQGVNTVDANGNNHGYGLLHIEAGHGEEIRNAGYASVEEFVEMVAKNYTVIREGQRKGNSQTYLLEVLDNHKNTLYIQLSKDGSYWNVNSAGIFRKTYSRRKPEVYAVPAVGGSTLTDTPDVNSGHTMGETAPAGNSPQTSGGKGNNFASDKQENAGESLEGGKNSEGTAEIPLDGSGEPMFVSVPAERSHAFIYEEGNMSRQEADEFVAAKTAKAQKALEKLQRKPPKVGDNWIAYQRAKAQWQEGIKAAEAEVAYWGAVLEIENERRAAARAEAERRAAAEAETERKRLEGLGLVKVARERYQSSPRVEGANDIFVTPDGRQYRGRYILVESGVVTASHDARNGFVQSEGAPRRPDGTTLNDRDYEHDQMAQHYTRDGANTYDSRALQSPVVVTPDGVVVSGNGRTMMGELAAEAGTDVAYVDYLRKMAWKLYPYPRQRNVLKACNFGR